MNTRDEDAGRDDIYWIVIIRGQKGSPIPMHDGDGPGGFEIFHTKSDAFAAARANTLGALYGFKVIRWGYA